MTAPQPATGEPPVPARQTRVRASETALTVALKVIREQGLAVDKLLIKGGQFELHFGGVEPEAAAPSDKGLKQW